MIITDLEAYLRADAEKAGITTFFIGYIEDMQVLRGNKDHYPVLRMLPQEFPIGWQEGEEYQTSLNLTLYWRSTGKSTDPLDKLSDRVSDWKEAIAFTNTFIKELHTGTYMRVLNEPVIGQLLPEGQVQERVVAINFKLDITLFC